MRAAVARLLTDARYQQAFFAAPPGAADEFGLTPDEFAQLRQLDARKLGITTEGFSGKRLERVASSFPLTLAALQATASDAPLRYLAQTVFPPDERAERETFAEYLRHGGDWAPHVRRSLLDLADAEAALAARGPSPPLPALRLRPDATRPRRTPLAAPVHLRGPIERALAAGRPPDDYAESPRDALVLREGRALRVEPLDDARLALLAACDGTRTVADLARAHAGDAAGILEGWLVRGIVDDASAERSPGSRQDFPS